MAMQIGQGGGGSRRRGRRGGRAPVAEINVTPFVDVMLVLLIIFMVAAPLLTTGVPVDLPESAATALPTDDEPVTISLDSGGALYIGDQPIDAADLPQAIEELIAANGGTPPPVNLRGDSTLQYGFMMRIMGDLNAAGVTQIGLVSVSSPGT